MNDVNILLVEDEAITALGIKKMLQDLEYRVSNVVTSGEDAVVLTEKVKPGLVLMDIGLSGDIDGIEAATHIRQKLDIPVVYITAATDRDTLQRAKLSEPYGYIIKPVSINDLYTTIETVLYRHRLGLKLKQNEAQYRTLVETISQGMIEYNLDGIITFCNESFSHMTGFDKDEIINASFNTFTGNRNIQFQINDIDKDIVSRQHRYSRYYDILKRKNKDPLDVQIDWDFKFDEKNRLNGIIAVITDITENIKSEKLRHIEHNIALSLSTASEITEAFKSITGILAMLPEFKDVCIFKKDGPLNRLYCISRTFNDDGRCPDIWIEPASPSYKLIMRDSTYIYRQDAIPGELKTLYPDKTLKSATVIPIMVDETIDSVLVCLSIQDADISLSVKNSLETLAAHIGSVIKRLHAEEALKKSESRYRQLVETMTDGIFIINADDIITYANNRLVQMLDYAIENIINRPVTDFLDNDNGNTMLSVLHAWGAAQRGSFELEWIKSSGDTVYSIVSPQKLHNENNSGSESFAVVTDITEHKKLEQELIKIQRLESLNLLAGGIAHDYNNILTGILGNVNLAKLMVDRGSDIFEILDEAESASLKARDISQQLLTFSRGGEPIKKPLNIKTIIENSSSFALRGSNANSNFLLPDDLWIVEADRGQISQVIDNIIINAKQSMSEGGIITISGENVVISGQHTLPLQEGRYVLISVHDEGKGIPPEYADRVFDLFFSTKQKGNGIGLASSFSIMKKHNGYLCFDSSPGQGTTFYIYIPASDKNFAQEIPVEQKIEPGQGNILVMDDEEIIRKIAKRMLSKLGYSVFLAEDGEEAFRIYQKSGDSHEKIDIVLMDLTVPGGMGGKEAAKKILAIDPEACIIASSGYANDPIKLNFHQYGFKNFLPKPYKLHELIETIKASI